MRFPLCLLIAGLVLSITPFSCTSASASDEKEYGWAYIGPGVYHSTIKRYPSKLKGVIGKGRLVNGFAVQLGEKFNSNWCLESLLSTQKNGDLIIANILAGLRYDLSAFAKTFFTPWAAAYLGVHYLYDRSGAEENYEGEEESQKDPDWMGLGVSWRAGVSVRLARDLALEFSYARTGFGTLGMTDAYRCFGGKITGQQYSLAFIMYALP